MQEMKIFKIVLLALITFTGQSRITKSHSSYNKTIEATCKASNICKEECEGELPKTELECPQCSSLGCGSVIDNLNVYCSCDASCVFYRDCCQDFETQCPLQNILAKEMLAKQQSFIEPSCVLIQTISQHNRFKIVDSCNGVRCLVNETSSNLDQYPLPVYDNVTGMHFISYDCAICNNITHIEGWISELTCIVNTNKENITTDDIATWLVNGLCKMRLEKPKGLRLCIEKTISDCDTCHNIALKSACKLSSANYVSNHLNVYHNPYCASCNLITANLMCGLNHEIDASPPYLWDIINGPSLSVFFNFKGTTKQQGLVLKTDFRCLPPYALIKKQCVAPFCKIGKLIRNSFCSNRSKEEIAINVSFSIVNSNQTFEPLEAISFVNESQTHIKLALVNITRENNLFGEKRFYKTFYCSKSNNYTSFKESEKSDLYNWTCFVIFIYDFNVDWKHIVTLQSKDVSNNKHLIQTILTGVIHQTVKDFLISKEGMLVELVTKSPYGFFHHPARIKDKVPTLNDKNQVSADDHYNLSLLNTTCVYILYHNEDYVLEDDFLFILELDKPVPSDQFMIYNKTAYVCKEFYDKCLIEVHWLIHHSTSLLITTYVALGLSILSLITRCFLQAFVPLYWTFPNKLQFILCLSICATFSLVFFVPMVTTQPKICYSFALLLHWGFLATFSCKLCVAVDMYAKFKATDINSSTNQGKKLLYNVLLCWGCPFVFVAISSGLDYTNIDSYYKPQYSVKRCWITNQFAHIAYFGVPIGVLLLIIYVTFILTSIHLTKTIKTTTAVKKRSHVYKFKLNVKLASLSGITWITAFIASVVNHLAVWYIFIILCGLQGVFIAIGFVFTQSVWNSLSKNIKDLKHTTQNGWSNSTINRNHRSTNHTKKNYAKKQIEEDCQQDHLD